MKKVISLCLVFIMAFTLCVPCYATDELSNNTAIVDSVGNEISFELLPVEGKENQFVFYYYMNDTLHTEYYITEGAEKITAIPKMTNERSADTETYELSTSEYVSVSKSTACPEVRATTYGTRFGRINYRYCEDADATFYAILTSNGARSYNDTFDINAEKGDRLGDVAAVFASALIDAGLVIASVAGVTVAGVTGFASVFIGWFLSYLGAVAADNIVKVMVRETVDCRTTEYDISADMYSDDVLSGVVFDTYNCKGYSHRIFHDDSPVETATGGIVPSDISTWNTYEVAETVWIETILFPANYDYPDYAGVQRL